MKKIIYRIVALIVQIAALAIIFVPGTMCPLFGDYNGQKISLYDLATKVFYDSWVETDLKKYIIGMAVIVVISLLCLFIRKGDIFAYYIPMVDCMAMIPIPYIIFKMINNLNAAMPYEDTQLGALMTNIHIALIICGIVGLVIYCTEFAKVNHAKQEVQAAERAAERARIAAEQKKAEDEKREQERIRTEREKALEFYRVCRRKDITPDLDSDKFDKNIRIVASNMGIDKLETAKSMYELGASVENDNKIQSIKDNHEKEKEQYFELLSLAKKSPKDKYLKDIIKSLSDEENKYNNMILSSEAMKKLSSTVMRPMEKSSTASFVGGHVVGGPLLGAVAASETKKENERAKADYEEAKRKAAENSAHYDNNIREYTREKAKISRKLSACQQVVDDLIVDENEMQEKFELLSFSNWRFRHTSGNNINVYVDVKFDKSKVQLFDTSAIIDGSLKFEVMDNSGKVVATGCYTRNFTKFKESGLNGFRSSAFDGQVEAVCITDDYESVNLVGLTCNVTPIKMWFAEKLDDWTYNRITSD